MTKRGFLCKIRLGINSFGKRGLDESKILELSKDGGSKMRELAKKKSLIGRAFVVLALLTVIGGCGQQKEAQKAEGKEEKTAANTDIATADASEEKQVSAEEKNADTVFDMDWEGLKTQWNESMTSVNPDLATIEDFEEKESAYGLLRTGTINESQSIGVSAATDNDSGKLKTAAVFGIMDDNKEVTSAAINLVNIADSTISTEKKQEISEALGLVDGAIIENGQSTYKENGLMYYAIYDNPEDLDPTLGLTIQEVE